MQYFIQINQYDSKFYIIDTHKIVMADSLMSYGIVIGVFAFLAALLFASRARRYQSGYTAPSPEHSVSEAA
ncbi:MAG: hypothetical protein DA330_08990 [Nitrososphaera sp.]|nr:hypothetical protein [Nitrososphaera sp.]